MGGKKEILKGIRVSGLNEVIWRELLSLLSEMNWIKSPNQSLSLLHSTLTAAQLQIIRWEETFNCGIRRRENLQDQREKFRGRVSCLKSNQRICELKMATAPHAPTHPPSPPPVHRHPTIPIPSSSPYCLIGTASSSSKSSKTINLDLIL